MEAIDKLPSMIKRQAKRNTKNTNTGTKGHGSPDIASDASAKGNPSEIEESIIDKSASHLGGGNSSPKDLSDIAKGTNSIGKDVPATVGTTCGKGTEPGYGNAKQNTYDVEFTSSKD